MYVLAGVSAVILHEPTHLLFPTSCVNNSIEVVSAPSGKKVDAGLLAELLPVATHDVDGVPVGRILKDDQVILKKGAKVSPEAACADDSASWLKAVEELQTPISDVTLFLGGLPSLKEAFQSFVS